MTPGRTPGQIETSVCLTQIEKDSKRSGQTWVTLEYLRKCTKSLLRKSERSKLSTTKRSDMPAKKPGQTYRGVLKARISKIYGGDVTIAKCKKLKARKGATARDKQLCNWFINMQKNRK